MEGTPGRFGMALACVSCLLVILSVPALGSSPEAPPVIGYSDSGINPYHEEFRAPNWTAHPSTYIDGYPKSAKPLNLTLDADTFDEAWEADRDVWSKAETDQLYYVPGTRIVGMIDDRIQFEQEPAPGYDHDDHGHGTLVASAGSGNTLGTAPHSAIVMTSGGIKYSWMEGQPWIDVISISTAKIVSVPGFGSARTSHAIVEEGRSIFNGGGNGPATSPGTNLHGDQRGPPWIVQVGAARPSAQGGTPGTHVPANYDRPIQVLGTMRVPVAETDSMNGTTIGGGTSTATPRVAGHAAQLIDTARQRLNDVSHPPTNPATAYAKAPPETILPGQGPLADGSFNRTELESLLRQPAIPLPWAMPDHTLETLTFGLSPTTFPNNQPQPAEARYTWQGYGLHNFTANQHAHDILLGHEPWPDRPVDDRWHRFWQDTRSAYWATTLCQDDEFRGSYNGNCWTDPTLDLAASTQALVSGGLDRATR